MKLFSAALLAATAALSLTASVPTDAKSTAQVLTTGWYLRDVQILTVTTGSGGKCPNAALDVFEERVFYPGPSKTGYLKHIVLDASHDPISDGGPAIVRQFLSSSGPTGGKTPPAATGSTEWGTAGTPTITGTFSITPLSGTPFTTGTFEFSESLFAIGPFSAVGTGVIEYTDAGTSTGCVETYNYEEVFTGAK
jgi:hypothetical protein